MYTLLVPQTTLHLHTILHLYNIMEVVVKIKTIYGNHTLREDWESRTVKYRQWERCTQSKIKMETVKRVTPLKFRKVKEEGMGSGSSSESGT